MKIAHYNDGKGRHQSHEVYFLDDKCYEIDDGIFVNSHDLSSLIGYGDNFEEAKYSLLKQLDWLIAELDALRNIIDATPIVKVGCLGKELNEEKENR